MPRRKLITLFGIVGGSLILIITGYLYLTANKTVFLSDKTTINTPQTAVTRRIPLEEKGNPYEVTMDVTFDIKDEVKQNENHLFSYAVSILNGSGETLEQKSNNYNFYLNGSEKKGKKTVTIPLFTIKNLPTDTYTISIIIQPDKTKDQVIKLLTFSYNVKGNVVSIHPAIPLTALIIIGLSYFLLPKKTKTEKQLTQ